MTWLTLHTAVPIEKLMDLPVPCLLDYYRSACAIHYAEERERFYARMVAAHPAKDGVEKFVEAVYTPRIESPESREAERKQKIAAGISGLMRDFKL